ncbi:TetR family transcriptional regulator [Glaciibacter superstes]|uniref:TetR family transcriptional regulator n=1 Tax=Glaciibacter superstes TaxID=501023 RepID=UPI0003B640E5|nr:TetR family transcriptional regulator [Glaciibacter superstes]
MKKTVNSSRSYDATGRRARAVANRERVLEVARTLFLHDGYGATTIAAIAASAGVSAESVYKSFGGKSGLVSAIHERSLLGEGEVSAEQRSDLAQVEETSGFALMHRLGELASEVAPLVAPVVRLIQDAAAGGDPAMRELLREIEQSRYQRMLRNARVVAERGILAYGLSVDQAADVMWAYTAPEFYENLVVNRAWTRTQFGEFIARGLAAALLD